MKPTYALSIKEVRSMPKGVFEVTVTGKRETIHTVGLREAYYQKLTGGTISPEDLLKKSFAFLLAREQNTSILKEFDLEDITRYFPSFEEEYYN